MESPPKGRDYKFSSYVSLQPSVYVLAGYVLAAKFCSACLKEKLLTHKTDPSNQEKLFQNFITGQKISLRQMYFSKCYYGGSRNDPRVVNNVSNYLPKQGPLIVQFINQRAIRELILMYSYLKENSPHVRRVVFDMIRQNWESVVT